MTGTPSACDNVAAFAEHLGLQGVRPMFLTWLVKQNPQFAEAVIHLHRSGALPPDIFLIDLDMRGVNA
jgi:hypothetical protein